MADEPHLELLAFWIKQGARADQQGLAGVSPMRKVLVRVGYLELLLKAGGDLEEQHYQTNLIEQAMEEGKPLAFAIATVLVKFIRMQFENPHLDTFTRKILSAALSVLMQQNPLLDWYLTLDTVKQDAHATIVLGGVITPKGY
eukprot:TRINITY_DN9319_c0_g1_i7.p1 TRINITY_DN9319_c0_g1~~TRINITY_DN9319_c0_g1_i7.p1  ORF type:complete len:143 (+),score=14.17 TRINITY_DN9319_c0_g1_i7:26-454(+)